MSAGGIVRFFPKPPFQPVDSESKTQYTYREMLETAKRLRSPGVSNSTGRRRKRRSVQPVHERRKLQKVFLAVLLMLMAVVSAILAYTVMKDHAPAGSGRQVLPTAPAAP